LGKEDTVAHLEKFLVSDKRPHREVLEQRNILYSNDSLHEATKGLENANKKKVLTSLLKRGSKMNKIKKDGKYKGEGAWGAFGLDWKILIAKEEHKPYGDIPYIVTQCVDYLEKNGLEKQGLFRIAGKFVEKDDLRSLCKTGFEKLNLEKYEVHVVASVLKQYIRELPEPLFPYETYDSLMALTDIKDLKERMINLVELVKQIPPDNTRFLNYLFTFLSKVAKHSDINLMTSANLGIIFAPNLLKPKVDTLDTAMGNAQRGVEMLATFIEWGGLTKPVGSTSIPATKQQHLTNQQ